MTKIIAYEGRQSFHWYTDRTDAEPTSPVIKCACGSRTPIVCDSFTNGCDDCGAEYNFAAQRLAPRDQWDD